jgi:hypothetical protein
MEITLNEYLYWIRSSESRADMVRKLKQRWQLVCDGNGKMPRDQAKARFDNIVHRELVRMADEAFSELRRLENELTTNRL